ncbi:MAG: SRPBCC family protein [Acidimicrobiia bacterium]|nr:SRPBCC family protein [Acidimicrobiia bacterium]
MRPPTITITASILIDRSQEDVFTFACDYRNDPQWRSGVADMRLEPGTRLTTGHHTHEIMKVLGRTTTTEAEITIHQPPHKTGFRTVGGDLTANGHRLVEIEGRQTRFTYQAHADLDRLYQPFTTPIQCLLTRRAQRDANHLKALLERTQGCVC